MSEPKSLTAAAGNRVTLETGLEALQSSPEFRGPVEPLDDHEHAHANDHFALIYGSQEEQFAAAIPFIRQGLERDERCLYITYENSREEVVAAMRSYDIDVDAALDSGQLSIHDEEETYLRNETFDADETVEFIDAAIEEATEEYEALRMTGEMSSVLQEDPECEELIKCEAKANYLFDDVDGIALCQYNRNQFPTDVIRDVISTHPLLIHDQRVSHNVYYTPPEEFFGPEKSDREVDRLLGTLREQTDAKAELEHRERFLRESYEITSAPALDFEQKLERLLELGCEWFDLEMAGLNHLPSWDGDFRLEKGVDLGVDPGDKPLWTNPGEGCFCRQTIEAEEPVGMVNVQGTNWQDDQIHQEFGLTSYLGTKVTSGATPYGTLWFGSTESRDHEFSETEHTFIELIGQWVSYEIERREHNEAQRVLYEVTSDPDRSFDEKLDALFELGCEQFGLDLGGMAKVDPEAESLEVEHVSGDHETYEPGLEFPLSETFCATAVDSDAKVSIADSVAAGYDDRRVYRDHGFETYLGTPLDIEGDHDRTLFFMSEELRNTEFSEAERTFLDLMGQWTEYELERHQREQELRESKERLASNLAATRQLQETSTSLIQEDDIDTLYEEVLDAAITIMDSDFASLQILDADRGELELLAHRGFTPEAAEFWEWVRPKSGSTCGVALDTGQRVVAPDVETCDIMAGTDDREMYRQTGILAVQTTPLVSRSGDVLGMISTHWKQPHEPSERDLRLLDVLARQAADLIERTQSEEALRKSEERLRLALEAADMGVWELNLQTKDSPVRSPQHDRIFGYEEPLGDWSFERFLDHVHPDDRERVEQSFKEAFETGDWVFECRIIRADNEQRSISAYGEFYYDSEGEPGRAVGIVQDITGRKEREERLEQKTDRLESFASLLAHELRNPTMIGQIYSQQLPDDTDSEAVEYVTEAFDRIEDMIDVMLVLTRGREAVGERIPVDLAGVAEEAWADVDAPDASLNIDIDEIIEADETYIQHLFRNLLENAVEHGGADVAVTVGDLSDGFYVADDGPGIPPEDWDAVFDEGYTTAGENGGTGLGLAFVQKLAEVYDWDYEISDSEAGGARFEFHIV